MEPSPINDPTGLKLDYNLPWMGARFVVKPQQKSHTQAVRSGLYGHVRWEEEPNEL